MGATVRSVMDLPVFVVNDANAALAGEWAYGAARGCRDVGMLTLGTGIGSSVILDGVPLRGRHGSAGNLGGHFVANVDGAAVHVRRDSGVPRRRRQAGRSRRWRAPTRGSQPARWPRRTTLDYRAVFRLAAAGDAVAAALRDRSVQRVGGRGGVA